MNETIFSSIESDNQAYWLGFITADGSVNKTSLQIGLASRDISHLEKFRKFIDTSNSITTRQTLCTNNGKYYSASYLSITSKRIRQDLRQYGIVPDKSHKNINFLEIILDKYKTPYILGVFDGDGWFTKTKNMNFGICGNYLFMDAIRQYLNNQLHFIPEIKHLSQEKRSPITYYMATSSKYNLYQFITQYLSYKNSCDLLDRKVEIAYLLLDQLSTMDCIKRKEVDKDISKKASPKTIKKTCPICHQQFFGRPEQKYCSYECSAKSQRKVFERPTREELKSLIRSTSFVAIGRQYGVTDNAIRKWCKAMQLPYKTQDIKLYSDEEWLKI